MQFAGEPLLIADDSRNVILIRALQPDYARIMNLLEKLDNIPRQVLIETLVAEVKLTNDLSYGIDWFIENKAASILGNDGVQSIVSDHVKIGDTAPGGLLYKFLSPAGTVNNVKLFINALASTSDFTVLASPHVLVLNNESATVNVGDEVPIVTGETVRDSTTTDSFDRTIQYKDTGIILTVTPQINYNGMITMELEQEISTAVETVVSGINSPTINKRKITTKLAVKNGQSILIGGLIRKDENKTNSGVPYLKDVPILGKFFSYTSENLTKSELLIMITPYVIETEDALDVYIRNFKEHVNSLRTDLIK